MIAYRYVTADRIALINWLTPSYTLICANLSGLTVKVYTWWIKETAVSIIIISASTKLVHHV